MVSRILSAALIACLVGLSTAQAADPKVNEMIDAMDPACRHKPLSQMTRAKMEECEKIEKFFTTPFELLKRLGREEETRQAKPRCGSILVYRGPVDEPEVVSKTCK
jgi:hypothetical protein